MKNKSFIKRLPVILAVGSVLSLALIPVAQSQLVFRNTVTGMPLDLSFAKKGDNTPQEKEFLNTGRNPYNGDKKAEKIGHSLFLTSCSGCHGGVAEGKIGPALGDAYWTYPKNATDKGLFETIFGGARSMMGPHYHDLSINQMLQVMAFLRGIYWGAADKAMWLTPEQRKTFKPAPMPEEYKESLAAFKKQNAAKK